MTLSILIPTYNRSEFLIKNLELLFEYIQQLPSKNDIEIIVSNNCSPDNTHESINDFIHNHPDFKINYHLQVKNIGLQANSLFVLEESNSEYIMYLGDDDFLDFEYLEGVFKYIQDNKNIFTIIPAFYPIDLKGVSLGEGRDCGLPNQVFTKGILNCYTNSYRGHQLSGLVLKREGLLNEYLSKKVNNIYPFIFFVAYNCLRGETYHYTQYPVRVSQPNQDAKDWNYGKDGLLNDVFDNYDKLEIGAFQKTKLQLLFYKKQKWRLWLYKEQGNKQFINAFCEIWFAKNTNFLFKFIFPVQVIVLKMYQVMKRCL